MSAPFKPASVIILFICVLCVTIGGGYLAYRLVTKNKTIVPAGGETAQHPLKRMANLPEKKELVPPPPPPEYKSDAPILEQARQALRDGITPGDAFTMAQTLPEGPERADAAFLLLEYAAETGHPRAALQVAGFYDPTHTDPSGTIRKNPAMAKEWYEEALAGGLKEAQGSLEQLRSWVSDKADQGSIEARDLLKQWSQDHP